MDSFKAFQEKLDNEHKWPTEYMFKFVVPKSRVDEIRGIFGKEALTFKNSKAGNYVAFTMKKRMNSSDEVIEIYKKAEKIEGLIAL